MRGNLDFSSWDALGSTLLGLVLVSAIAVGIRLVFMQTIQRRRERENRQINERLKTLIAAYKTLGGSFTGELAVDPGHLRDLRRASVDAELPAAELEVGAHGSSDNGSERRRRIRDAVEAALSDVILLGTEEQVALAAAAANEMVAGRAVHTAELVVSLRTFIRQALDLEAISTGVQVPRQGPLRVATGGSGGKRGGDGSGGGGRGGSGGAGGMGAGVGMGMGAGAGLHAGRVEAGEAGLTADAAGNAPGSIEPRG